MHIVLDPNPCVRFILADWISKEAHARDGKVVVFRTREEALACNEGLSVKYQVMGMTEAKWETFQKEVPHVVATPHAVA